MLTAQTLSGVKVYAPDLIEKRQEFKCRFCNQPMSFVDAQIKIKHFRHKTKILCDYEPETEEHERYKEIVYQFLKSKNYGEVYIEHSIGKFIADIYLKRPGHCNDMVFEIQATNYDIVKFEKKINSYAFRKFVVIYIFIGNNFFNEIKPNIYTLKEIEKRIFTRKIYLDTVIGCYLKNENIIIPLFKEKHVKGRIGCCTDRFITDHKQSKKLPLNDFLDSILEYYIKNPFVPPECSHQEFCFEKSEMKITRYKEVCSDCGKFIRWMPNKEARNRGLSL
jgi:hypothetical protein